MREMCGELGSGVTNCSIRLKVHIGEQPTESATSPFATWSRIVPTPLSPTPAAPLPSPIHRLGEGATLVFAGDVAGKCHVEQAWVVRAAAGQYFARAYGSWPHRRGGQIGEAARPER